MPKASSFVKPKFLSADDVREFGDDGRVTQIVASRAVRVGNEQRLAVAFAGIDRQYVCNQHNLETLIEMHGGDDDTLHWKGTAVRIYVDENVLFDNQQVGGIMIEAAPTEAKRGIFGGAK